jgi:hypothetical protein
MIKGRVRTRPRFVVVGDDRRAMTEPRERLKRAKQTQSLAGGFGVVRAGPFSPNAFPTWIPESYMASTLAIDDHSI